MHISNTDIMQVDINISNAKLYYIFKDFKEIVNTKRKLDKYESLPSCNVYITDKPSDSYTDIEAISIKFDINNRFDPRWKNMFPQTLQDINPYLRFALMNEIISPKLYNCFENTLINEQNVIVKEYKGFHIFLSEVRENPEENLYEFRTEYSLHNNTILLSNRIFNQLKHPIDFQDMIIDNSKWNAYTTFITNS